MTFVLLVVGIVVVGGLAYAVRAVLVQFAVAIVLAMALEPLVEVFERRGLRRGGAVAVTFSVVAVAALAFA